MRIQQHQWTEISGWQPRMPGNLKGDAHLVLVFGSSNLIKNDEKLKEIKSAYPNAAICGCTTAGEIFNTQVTDNSLSVTAIHLQKTSIKTTCVQINDMRHSEQAGEQLGRELDQKGLVHIFVLAEGVHINGSDFVKGLVKNLSPHVSATGGLAGDGTLFEETRIVYDGRAVSNTICAIGFYGDDLKVGYGSMGGWDPYGPERLVTRSRGNILYELDDKKALELYKLYLGEYASGLPATGLLFPLSVRTRENQVGLVRTILAVDEKEQSLIFAGNLPKGYYARFMKANFDRLINGATEAAEKSIETLGTCSPELAILVSCVGRKMVLKQRVEEEVEAVQDVVGPQASLTGFYSYGEIAPPSQDIPCELHNQTMTITTLSES